MELPHEQYVYQKTLADIGVAIAKGRAELAELGTKTEVEVQKQQEEILRRVDLAVKASEIALNQVHSNQLTLESYHQELQNFALELHKWNETLTVQQQDFEARKGTFEARLAKKTEELTKIAETLKVQQGTVEKDRQQNYSETVKLNDRERMVNDKYQTLLRTQKRL